MAEEPPVTVFKLPNYLPKKFRTLDIEKPTSVIAAIVVYSARWTAMFSKFNDGGVKKAAFLERARKEVDDAAWWLEAYIEYAKVDGQKLDWKLTPIVVAMYHEQGNIESPTFSLDPKTYGVLNRYCFRPVEVSNCGAAWWNEPEFTRATPPPAPSTMSPGPEAVSLFAKPVRPAESVVPSPASSSPASPSPAPRRLVGRQVRGKAPSTPRFTTPMPPAGKDRDAVKDDGIATQSPQPEPPTSDEDVIHVPKPSHTKPRPRQAKQTQALAVAIVDQNKFNTSAGDSTQDKLVASQAANGSTHTTESKAPSPESASSAARVPAKGNGKGGNKAKIPADRKVLDLTADVDGMEGFADAIRELVRAVDNNYAATRNDVKAHKESLKKVVDNQSQRINNLAGAVSGLRDDLRFLARALGHDIPSGASKGDVHVVSDVEMSAAALQGDSSGVHAAPNKRQRKSREATK
ncbi:hypothetical protein CONPUDRAFT_149394 [Coniophora puteana RWD-64-598 SS2]|uniref:Uncharacterized protein n=1 Tax=Coniophora puteana (strain RWD-64-598) TaxID=741705 RepID=A0A5M3N7F0_CONPW|nr:uncharacterized protein CONPUDRAFT_149394 [Coniophora puteana RWD-64-598 SS2]EIW87363.1 hypothetical protein CONPUDRAFT_149394 [Coniophora puteana RWD-64-598 SS2]